MLVPACILILVMLAAIAVDSAGLYLAHREMQGLADGAANDVATAALDLDAFYLDSETLVINDRQASELTRQIIERWQTDSATTTRITEVQVTVAAATVRVVIEAEADPVFAPAVLGGSSSITITAIGQATARAQ